MAKRKTELELSLIDNVTRGLRGIEKGVSGLGASILKINAAAELAAKGINLIGSAAGVITDTVGAAADLEATLARISELSQATAEEQQAYYEAVTTAGDRYLTTAEQAAEALRLLTEDGFRGAEAVSALNTVLAFAQNNAQSAATAAGALGAVLDNYGEPAVKIAELADALTSVSREAGASTTAIQEGLQRAGVAAEQAGLSIEQTTALIGVLAKRGIEGGRAGQALATAIQDLANPASTAGKALEDLGLAGDDFLTVLGRLQADAGAAETVLSALGNRPRAAIQSLLDQGGGALKEFQQIVAESAGASERAGEAIGQTLNFQLNRLSNAIAKLKNDALAPILEPLADSADALADKLSELAGRQEFQDFVAQVGEFAGEAADKLVELVESFDFDEAVAKVSQFADDTVVVFDAVAAAAGVLVTAIRDVSEAYDRLKSAGRAIEEDNSKIATSLLTTTFTISGLARTVAGLADTQEQATQSTEGYAEAQQQVSDTAAPLVPILEALRSAWEQTQVQLAATQTEAAALPPTLRELEAALRAAAIAGDDKAVASHAAQLRVLEESTRAAGSAATTSAKQLGELRTAIAAALQAGDAAGAANLAAQYRAIDAEAKALDASVEKLIGTQQKGTEQTKQLADQTQKTGQEVKKSGEAAKEAEREYGKLADTGAKATGAAAAIATRIRALREEFSFSAAAADLFEQQLEKVNRRFLGSALSTSIGAYVSALEAGAAATRRAVAAQAELADEIEAGLDIAPLQGNLEQTIEQLRGLESETRNATGQFRLLSEQRLDKLRSEINATISAIERQQQAVASLIDIQRQLQDEADRRAGNEDEIAERQYQDELRRIAELEAAGGASAKAAAEEARRLAKQNHEAELREIRERADEQRRQDSQTEQTRSSSRQQRERERQSEQAARATDSGGLAGASTGRGAVAQPVQVTINYGPLIGDLGTQEGVDRLARTLAPAFDNIRRRSA